MRRYKNDPRVITARFGNCAKCNKNVKGEQVYFWPSDKNVYCMNCGQADYNSFLQSAQDEEFYNSQY